MNSGLVLVFILFFIYSIYIIRNNMISIAGIKIKRSPMLLAAQLSQMLIIVLLFSFSGTFIHSWKESWKISTNKSAFVLLELKTLFSKASE